MQSGQPAGSMQSSRPSHHCSCLSDRRACPNLQGDLVCRQSSVLASPLSAVQVVMEKDGKVIIKTPDGRLIVQEDRAKGQVSVSTESAANCCLVFCRL